MNLRDLYRASPHAAAAKRQILRDALRSAVRLGIDIGIDLPGLNTARLDDMIEAADRLPDSIATLLADRLAAPVQAEAEAEPVQAEAEAEAEPVQAEPVQADSPALALTDLADQIRGLLSGDLGTLSARVSALADSAAEAIQAEAIQAAEAAEPVQAAEAGAVPAVSVRVTGTRTIGSITGQRAGLASKTITTVRASRDVPAIDPDYVWPADSDAAMRAIEAGGHVFLHGPRGTGKSSFAQQFAATTGRPFVRITFSAQTQMTDLLGAPALADGRTCWAPGPLVVAYGTPYAVILLDEPSLCPAETITGLNGLLDGHGVTLPDGRHVRPARGVTFILADNTNGRGDDSGLYAGTGTLNAAFCDRPWISVRAEYLPAAREAAMLASRTGTARDVCVALVSFAKITRDAASSGTISEGLSPRRLLALATLIGDDVPASRALSLAVLNGLDESDRLGLSQIAAASWPSDAAWTALLAGKPAPAPASDDPAQQRARADFAAADVEG